MSLATDEFLVGGMDMLLLASGGTEPGQDEGPDQAADGLLVGEVDTVGRAAST